MHDRYAALVKGPSTLFPRGFLWLIPTWFAAIALLLKFKTQTPPWYGYAALLGLLLAASTLLLVLTFVRNNAFVADGSGIWLGLRAGATRRLGRRRRTIRPVPWPQIEQLRIVPRAYGARLDVMLGGPAPMVSWPRALAKIAANSLLLILPISYLFRTPGLLTPRTDPARYRIPLYDVTAAELRVALRHLAPATVQVVEIPRWRIQAMRQRRALRPAPHAPPAPLRPVPLASAAADQQSAHGHMIA